MNNGITKRLTVALVALVVVGLAVPAAAHPGVSVFQGATAHVTPTDGASGLGMAFVDDHHANWSLGPVSTTNTTTGLPAEIEADGELYGGCGWSMGVGSGTFTHDGVSHSFSIHWTGSPATASGWYAGGRIIAPAQASADPFPLGTLTACVNGTANSFNVNLVVTTIGA